MLNGLLNLILSLLSLTTRAEAGANSNGASGGFGVDRD
jgi:hypothetical protein